MKLKCQWQKEKKTNQKKLTTQLFPVKFENEDIISTIRSWNSDWAHVHDYISIRMILCDYATAEPLSIIIKHFMNENFVLAISKYHLYA